MHSNACGSGRQAHEAPGTITPILLSPILLLLVCVCVCVLLPNTDAVETAFNRLRVLSSTEAMPATVETVMGGQGRMVLRTDGSNYREWASRMRLELKIQGLLDVVDVDGEEMDEGMMEDEEEEEEETVMTRNCARPKDTSENVF